MRPNTIHPIIPLNIYSYVRVGLYPRTFFVSLCRVGLGTAFQHAIIFVLTPQVHPSGAKKSFPVDARDSQSVAPLAKLPSSSQQLPFPLLTAFILAALQSESRAFGEASPLALAPRFTGPRSCSCSLNVRASNNEAEGTVVAAEVEKGVEEGAVRRRRVQRGGQGCE